MHFSQRKALKGHQNAWLFLQETKHKLQLKKRSMDPSNNSLLIHSSSRNKTNKENMEIAKHKLNEDNKKMRNQ